MNDRDARFAECTIEDGRFLNPCSFLSESLEPTSPRKNGITLLELRDFSGNPQVRTRTFGVIRSGEHRKKGIAMNYCPFCGKNVSAPFTKEPSND